MNDTLYTIENWYRPTEMTPRMLNYWYEDLLREVLGLGGVLHYIEEDQYQGDWCALVTDGKRIGLVEGSFGSCSGCDALADARSTGSTTTVLDVMEEYLQSVRTFSTWEDVMGYLLQSEADRLWSLRNVRPELIEFVSARISSENA